MKCTLRFTKNSFTGSNVTGGKRRSYTQVDIITQDTHLPLQNMQYSYYKESYTWMPGFKKCTNIICMITAVCRFKSLCREWHHSKARCNITNVKIRSCNTPGKRMNILLFSTLKFLHSIIQCYTAGMTN